MLTRGPEAFILSLYEAFDRRLKVDRELLHTSPDLCSY
jgi:hypothetical protein